jgi:hypothetical protein
MTVIMDPTPTPAPLPTPPHPTPSEPEILIRTLGMNLLDTEGCFMLSMQDLGDDLPVGGLWLQLAWPHTLWSISYLGMLRVHVVGIHMFWWLRMNTQRLPYCGAEDSCMPLAL